MKKFFKHKLQNLLVIKEIVTIHYLDINKDFEFENERHDFWEIVLCDKGSVFCNIENKPVPLKQGEMIFIKPNVLHSISGDKKNFANVFISSFVSKSEAMNFFIGKVVKLNKDQIKHAYAIVEDSKKTFNLPRQNPYLTKMPLLPHPTLGGEQLIKNHLELLLIDIMRMLTETEYGNKIFLPEDEIGNKVSFDVIKILKDNIYNRLSIDDICKIISYSKVYVFKQFKLATGKSVMEYFTSLKIDEAKRLLKENNLSIKEIAEKLAFDEPNYFSKTFKKITGVTPSEYKNRILS